MAFILEWNGMENGMELETTSQCNGPGMSGMEWNEWNGQWNGMEWNGMEWNGMEWNGMEWNGISWRSLSDNQAFILKKQTTQPLRSTDL